jgi:hypothetical protein
MEEAVKLGRGLFLKPRSLIAFIHLALKLIIKNTLFFSYLLRSSHHLYLDKIWIIDLIRFDSLRLNFPDDYLPFLFLLLELHQLLLEGMPLLDVAHISLLHLLR